MTPDRDLAGLFAIFDGGGSPTCFYTVQAAARHVATLSRGEGAAVQAHAEFMKWAATAEPGECSCFWGAHYVFALKEDPGDGIFEVEDYDEWEAAKIAKIRGDA